MTRPFLAVPITVGVFFGCGGSVPPVEPVSRPPTHVAASLDRAWNATADVLTDRRLSIRTLDRASGIILINTVRVDVERSATYYHERPHKWADCGNMGARSYIHPTFAAYTFRVRGDGAGSTVQMTIDFSSARNAASMAKAPCTSRGVLETEFEHAVSARAGVGG